MKDKGLYNQLNKSQDIEHSFKSYNRYRNEITTIINEVIEESVATRVDILIFGAGNLMDIDYKTLSSNKSVNNITITDIDRESLVRGVEFWKIDQDNVIIEDFNYILSLGYDNNLNLVYNQLNLPYISQEESHKALEAFLSNVFEEFTSSSYLDYIKRSDVVIVLPIYTQLLYIELTSKLEGTKGYKYIKENLLQHMIGFIDMFNQKLIECIKPNGQLLVLSDIIEEVNNGLNYSKDEIELKISTYEKTYGVGLGSYGLLSINKYQHPVKEYFLQWTFNEQRQFLVKGVYFKLLR